VAKKKPDLDALGRQYREARDSIAVHRRAEAVASAAHSRLARRLGADHPDVAAAWDAVLAAHADVQWCKGLTIACGEAYKGVPLDEVPNRRPDVAAMLARLDEAS